MPKCTECGSSGEIGKFVYSRTKDREGFDINPTNVEIIDYYLICPDCDAILGGLESVDYTADIDL